MPWLLREKQSFDALRKVLGVGLVAWSLRRWDDLLLFFPYRVLPCVPTGWPRHSSENNSALCQCVFLGGSLSCAASQHLRLQPTQGA